MRLSTFALVLVGGGLSVALPLGAQEWRTVSTMRQQRPNDSLRVRLEFAGGTLKLGAAPTSSLYDVKLKYDAGRGSPAPFYDAATHTLTIKADSTARGWLGLRSHGMSMQWGGAEDVDDPSELALGLGRDAPLDLSLRLRAVDGTIDLGGLTVRRMLINARATEVSISFSSPNHGSLEELELDAGAAEILVTGLGDANAKRVRARGFLGHVDMDFGGAWTGETEVRANVTLGNVTLGIPRDAGVKVRLDKLAADFDRNGFVERDGVFYSANWETAARRLTVDAEATLAGLEIRWLDR